MSRQTLTVPAFSVSTVDYFDIKPNYFRVQNMGKNSLLCGTSSVPSAGRYDFSVPSEGMKMYAEPSRRNKLYIFNPSGTAINVNVLAFSAEFDPLTLALSEISFDLGGMSLETSNIIGGFNAPLPSGSNKIGKVEIDAPLPAGNNTLGGVEVVGIPASLTALLNGIRDTQVTNTALMAKLDEVISTLESGSSSGAVGETDMKIGFANQTASSESVTGFSYDAETLCEINFITNDGDKDVSMVVAANEGTNTVIIKAGETINDFKCYAKAISFGPSTSGEAVSFRSLYKYTVR